MYGAIGKTLICPYYLPQILNGDNYLEFLQNIMQHVFDEAPLNLRNRIIFQNDGCLANYRMRGFLEQQFPNR